MVERLGWGERQEQILTVLNMAMDGASPSELAREIGISTLHAAIYLAKFRKRGIVVKRTCKDGKCRYQLSSKGERKLAWLEANKE